MKKAILSVLAVFCAMSINAENSVGIKAIKVAKGTTSATLEIEVNNDYTFSRMQFDVLLPAGITPKMNSAGTTIHNKCIKVLDNERTYNDDDEDYIFAGTKGNSYVTEAGNKVVRFNGAGTIDVTPGTGSILSMDVVLDAGLAEGVYPIVINRVKLNNTANVGTPDAEGRDFISYIVVGNPKDATLALKGEIPSSVNKYLADEEGIGSLDLSAVTACHGEFAYTVGKAVTAPALTADVKVVAGLNGTYGSLCSPVELPGVKCYKFTGASGDVATFTEVDNVPANEVVIIDAAVDATVTGATLASVANGTADAGRLYVAPDGSVLRRAGNTVKVPALRGTWDIAGGSNLRIALDTPTGIKMIGTANEVFGNTYDLQGRQVENAQNGVYVVNGKKQFVK